MRDEIVHAGRDLAISAIAEHQHGLITTARLYELGLDRSAIHRRVQGGRLHRLYRGVYAVGHRKLSREAHWLAAVFACNFGAVLSHRSAAALWGMRQQSSGPIEVTVPRRGGRLKREGLRIHRATRLDHMAAARIRGIPVTTPHSHDRRPA